MLLADQCRKTMGPFFVVMLALRILFSSFAKFVVIVVLNAGAATFATGGGPITMNEVDVCRVCRTVPEAQVVAVHMETVNHCRLSRAALRTSVEAEDLARQVLIPDDGEVLIF